MSTFTYPAERVREISQELNRLRYLVRCLQTVELAPDGYPRYCKANQEILREVCRVARKEVS